MISLPPSACGSSSQQTIKRDDELYACLVHSMQVSHECSYNAHGDYLQLPVRVHTRLVRFPALGLLATVLVLVKRAHVHAMQRDPYKCGARLPLWPKGPPLPGECAAGGAPPPHPPAPATQARGRLCCSFRRQTNTTPLCNSRIQAVHRWSAGAWCMVALNVIKRGAMLCRHTGLNGFAAHIHLAHRQCQVRTLCSEALCGLVNVCMGGPAGSSMEHVPRLALCASARQLLRTVCTACWWLPRVTSTLHLRIGAKLALHDLRKAPPVRRRWAGHP